MMVIFYNFIKFKKLIILLILLCGFCCRSEEIVEEIAEEIVEENSDSDTNHTIISRFSTDIKFVFYNNINSATFRSNSYYDDLSGGQTGCMINDKLAIIIPGWREGCYTTWVQTMVRNLNVYRGGCIVCMDYSPYSNSYNYFVLISQFEEIVKVLANKLKQFFNQHFEPSRTFIFGFSYGAQLALEAGRRIGTGVIRQIDVCEPAGIGFDTNKTYTQLDPKNAAENVQCIHTSVDKGTSRRQCHQNWILGVCGWYQAAAGPPPMGSHGLCPHMYNSGFRNKFLAIPRPITCPPTEREVNTETLESPYFMGYVENRTNEITGDFYAATYKYLPYNIDITAGLNYVK